MNALGRALIRHLPEERHPLHKSLLTPGHVDKTGHTSLPFSPSAVHRKVRLFSACSCSNMGAEVSKRRHHGAYNCLCGWVFFTYSPVK